MQLTPAADADIDAAAALINEAYRGGEGWTNETDYLLGERTSAATLRADLKANPEALVLILRETADGPMLGCLWLEPKDSQAWGLGLLTVRPDQQDRQVGRTLLAHAESFVRNRGASRLRITVVNVRDTLIAWYERRGFRQTGDIEPFPYEDQRFGEPLRRDLAFVVLEKVL